MKGKGREGKRDRIEAGIRISSDIWRPSSMPVLPDRSWAQYTICWCHAYSPMLSTMTHPHGDVGVGHAIDQASACLHKQLEQAAFLQLEHSVPAVSPHLKLAMPPLSPLSRLVSKHPAAMAAVAHNPDMDTGLSLSLGLDLKLNLTLEDSPE